MNAADRAHFRARITFFAFLLVAAFLLGVAKAHYAALVAFCRAEPELAGVLAIGFVLATVAICLYLADDIRRAEISDPHRYCAEDDHGGRVPKERE